MAEKRKLVVLDLNQFVNVHFLSFVHMQWMGGGLLFKVFLLSIYSINCPGLGPDPDG
jgi:hypothetical protein